MPTLPPLAADGVSTLAVERLRELQHALALAQQRGNLGGVVYGIAEALEQLLVHLIEAQEEA